MTACWIIGDHAEHIERGATPRLYWRAAPDFRGCWTDPEHATRFARREDAEAMFAHLGSVPVHRATKWGFERGASIRPSEAAGGGT